MEDDQILLLIHSNSALSMLRKVAIDANKESLFNSVFHSEMLH